MRNLNTAALAVAVVLFIVFMTPLSVQGKSDKYKRPSSGPGAADAAAPVDSSQNANSSAGKDPKKSGKGEAQSGDKKVDLSDLENRYWTAKDTEFNVVQ